MLSDSSESDFDENPATIGLKRTKGSCPISIWQCWVRMSDLLFIGYMVLHNGNTKYVAILYRNPTCNTVTTVTVSIKVF